MGELRSGHTLLPLNRRGTGRAAFPILQMGGAVARVADDEPAFHGRTGCFTYNINAATESEAGFDCEREWVRRASAFPLTGKGRIAPSLDELVSRRSSPKPGTSVESVLGYGRCTYATEGKHRMAERLNTSHHKRMLAARMKDPEFRDEYQRARREIAQVDSVILQLDQLREQAGLSKAELARHIGRDPSSIRRLFTAKSNPELLLVASIAQDLDADLRVVPRKGGRQGRPRAA